MNVPSLTFENLREPRDFSKESGLSDIAKAPMIKIEGLTKRFGPETAVSSLSLTVGKGEVLGFLGPNGAGKSTTMKMVTGYLAPSSGRVRVMGHDLETDARAAQAAIGYLREGAAASPTGRPRRAPRRLSPSPTLPACSTSRSRRFPRASSAASAWRRRSC